MLRDLSPDCYLLILYGSCFIQNLCFLLQALYTQYLQFKEHEIPLKEKEKTKIQDLYKMLEVKEQQNPKRKNMLLCCVWH